MNMNKNSFLCSFYFPGYPFPPFFLLFVLIFGFIITPYVQASRSYVTGFSVCMHIIDIYLRVINEVVVT